MEYSEPNYYIPCLMLNFFSIFHVTIQTFQFSSDSIKFNFSFSDSLLS